MQKLTPFQTDETITVGILNNRSDRERRAIQFADVAVHDLDFDRLVTFGAYEGLVTDRLVVNGYAAEHILNLGDEHHATQDEIIRRMITEQPSDDILVVGFVNIHTHQAEEMLEYFEHQAEPWSESAAVAARRWPSVQLDRTRRRTCRVAPSMPIPAPTSRRLTTRRPISRNAPPHPNATSHPPPPPTSHNAPHIPQRTTTPERHLAPAAADLPQRTTTPERHLELHVTHDLSTTQHRSPLDQSSATLPRRLVEAGSALVHRPSDQSDALTHGVAPQPHARRDEDVPTLPRRGG